jgi:hypothetical protein
VYKGILYLEMAVDITKDSERQYYLKKGLEILEPYTTRVDLNKVVRLLIKCRNIT